MKAVSTRSVNSALDRSLPGWRDAGGWTYNVFARRPYIRLSERVGMKRILKATGLAVSSLARPTNTVMLFHDGLAAWRHKKKSNRGYRFSNLPELLDFLQTEIYFRDGRKSDNYNILDVSGKWMITFCHHADWYLFAPHKRLN